jgi:hypothetical protein
MHRNRVACDDEKHRIIRQPTLAGKNSLLKFAATRKFVLNNMQHNAKARGERGGANDGSG